MISSSSLATSNIPSTAVAETPASDRDNDVSAKDTMTASTQPVSGDRGNALYSKQLDVSASDAVRPSSQPVTGDRGNPYYSQQLDASAAAAAAEQDSMVSRK
jgi:hypothetical protein